MIIRPRQAVAAAICAGATLLGTLVTVAASELWDAKSDHERRLTTIEVENKSDHELLLEVRGDVKELLRREGAQTP